MPSRRRRFHFGSLSMKSCPREGSRVMFAPNPVSRLLYSRGHRLPKVGEVGTVTTIPGFGRGGRSTCLGGPGGGLVFVKWPSVGVSGISRYDLDKVKR